MKKNNLRNFSVASILLILFILWTLAIKYVDVQAIGPKESSVGFAMLNGAFHKLTGVHMLLYTITDWLGLIPVFIVMGFALLGLVQWIKRKNLLKVDYDILILGGFYVIVFAAYFLFEIVAINNRPVLIDGYLEASYPSSTTLMVLCVMPVAILQFNERIKNQVIRTVVKYAILAFTIFMVVGRLLSGVHWLTDIIGGIILSGSLVMFYIAALKGENERCNLKRKD